MLFNCQSGENRNLSFQKKDKNFVIRSPLFKGHNRCNGSKGERRTDAGFFCSNPYTEGSFELNDYISVFQTEIVCITEGAKWASNKQVYKPASG